jgi:hypothetical protein
MVIFHSYVELPEGNLLEIQKIWDFEWGFFSKMSGNCQGVWQLAESSYGKSPHWRSLAGKLS